MPSLSASGVLSLGSVPPANALLMRPSPSKSRITGKLLSQASV